MLSFIVRPRFSLALDLSDVILHRRWRGQAVPVQLFQAKRF